MRQFLLILVLALPALAATNRTVTVKTSGGDYTTLAAAIAGEKGNLVSLDRQLTIECYAMEDTTSVTIANADWTTDSTRYILITVPTAERHAGVWSDSKYRLVTSAGTTLSIQNEYVHLDGLQLRSTATSNYSASLYVGGTSNASGGTLYVRNCILRGNSDSYQGAAFGTYQITATAYFYNNLFYGADKWNGAYGVSSGTAGNYYFYNNTFAANHTALRVSGAGTWVMVNNLFTGNTNMTYATFAFAAGTDYNRTSNAALGYTVAGEGNTHDAVSQTFTFAAAGNYHLDATDAGAKDLGVSDPGSGLFSTDVDGETRSGSWDVGFDEIASSARRRNVVVASTAPPCKSERLFGGLNGEPVRVIVCGTKVHGVLIGRLP